MATEYTTHIRLFFYYSDENSNSDEMRLRLGLPDVLAIWNIVVPCIDSMDSERSIWALI